MTAWKRSTDPTNLPVSLEEVKDHLRIDTDDDNALIMAQIRAATDWVEDYTGRSLVTQTWDLFLDDWPADTEAVELPRPPLQSITSVAYTTEGASTQYGSSVSSTSWWVDTDSEPGRIRLKEDQEWPDDDLESLNPIRVRFVAGYGDDGSDVPEGIRAGLLVMVGDMYEHREDTMTGTIVSRRRAVERLLQPRRVFTAV